MGYPEEGRITDIFNTNNNPPDDFDILFRQQLRVYAD